MLVASPRPYVVQERRRWQHGQLQPHTARCTLWRTLCGAQRSKFSCMCRAFVASAMLLCPFPAHIKAAHGYLPQQIYQSSSLTRLSTPTTLFFHLHTLHPIYFNIMIAASVPSARFATGVRVATPARGVVARCMRTPEPETDAVPSSTSEGGVKDASAIALDVPSQTVDTPVLGPVQGESPLLLACCPASVHVCWLIVHIQAQLHDAVHRMQ